ncbi:hypothetical protein HPB49_012437 [Dermacentor silvarum]|uniref:Uncharacterized protein n=1 Tax=Dermacentor silvarum TaxID=543639 RepID=A0ACB8CXD9_DERSI|nr:hypothetical protein HPB49_012437 [Dermacentor silvarum]
MPRQRREKTDDQIAAEKRRRADARRLKRAQETSEQRAERLAQDRESRRTRRQQDTDQVRDARIVSDRDAKRAYRAAEETPEARAKRVIKGRQAQRKRRLDDMYRDILCERCEQPPYGEGTSEPVVVGVDNDADATRGIITAMALYGNIVTGAW